MNFSKIIVILLLFGAGINPSLAQEQQPMINKNSQNPKPSFGQRVYFGGYVGLQFGTQTLIDISPMMGYMVTPKLSMGLGLKYQYYKYDDPYYEYETNSYGGSVFARYNIWQGLFAYTEYEVLNMDAYDPGTREQERRNVGSWFVGGGYSQPLGSRASMYLMVLYNVNETIYSPYANPLFRIGFGVGI